MKAITYKIFQRHLKAHLDQVTLTHDPLLVKIEDGKEIIMLGLHSMQETFYLLKSPTNAARLLRGIEEYKKGKQENRLRIK